jgi:arylsulfatase A-like enzyme
MIASGRGGTRLAAWCSMVAALVIALAAGAAGCEHRKPRFPLRTEAGGRPNLLLITVDSLRVDHLGAYGYPVPTSPVIDRLASAGVRFTQSIATAPETAPAMASLLTGFYPNRSGVLQNGGTLPPHVPTLATRVHGEGYTTACLVGRLVLGRRFGFAQGCDHFEVFAAPLGPRASSDARAVDAAITWLDTSPPTPWLLWIHLMDPHGPYTSADPSWSEGFTYPPYMFGADEPRPLGKGNFGLGVIPKYQQIDDSTRPSEYLRRYDGEIRFTDAQIGRLLEALEARRAAADTLVVLTADHGESLVEHQELFQHGWYLYDTTIRVPLIFSWPGHLPASRVVESQVSGVDLLPTLYEALGLGRGGGQPLLLDGRTYAAQLFDEGDEPRVRAAFTMGAHANHPLSVRWNGWKLIQTPAGRAPGRSVRPAGVPAGTELYDLGADPDELVNVVPKHPQIAQTMGRWVTGFREALRPRARPHAPP